VVTDLSVVSPDREDASDDPRHESHDTGSLPGDLEVVSRVCPEFRVSRWVCQGISARDVRKPSRLDRLRSRVLRLGFVASGNNSVVECDLAKVEVAGSNPVSRSNLRLPLGEGGRATTMTHLTGLHARCCRCD
jgi:hypothetical protein